MYVETRRVLTRDNVALFTVIIRPEKEGKYPIILDRCPYSPRYDQELTEDNVFDLNLPLTFVIHRKSLVDAGYCYVYQHVRGTGNSEGQKMVYAMYDFHDAEDTMVWLREQDFYDGEIYRFGTSYTGMSALIDAKNHYPDVKGIVAIVPAGSFAHLMLHNDFIKLGLGPLWETGAARWYRPNPDFKFTPDSFRTLPQKDQARLIYGEGQATGYMMPYAQEHQNINDPYWRSPEAPGSAIYQSIETVDVPILLMTSWFCHVTDYSMDLWNHILPEETRKKSSFLITPYQHDISAKRESWRWDMEGSTMDEYFGNPILAWFDYLRTGKESPVYKIGKVGFFPECGQKKWYYEDKLSDGETEHKLFLNADRSLSENRGSDQEITYLYNPYNPAIYYNGVGHNIGYARSYVGGDYPNVDYTQAEDVPNSRYDIISFVSAPFEEETFLKGSMKAKLSVKSDCEDTCFYGRVMLVKDGEAHGLRDDITSLSFQLKDYTPRETVEIQLNFDPIVWAVKPGDQLRIDISSSCFPNYSIHTNVKGKQCEVTEAKIAHNSIICGKSSLTFYTSSLSDELYDIVEV